MEIGIKQGFHILDFGCGPGSFIIDEAKLVGESGKIYALDIQPVAIKWAQRIASENQLKNVQTIRSDCRTGLPTNSIDVVLLYDTLHGLSDPNPVLDELHRVLKVQGILSVTDHLMNSAQIVSKVTDKGLFTLTKKGKRTFSFTIRNVA